MRKGQKWRRYRRPGERYLSMIRRLREAQERLHAYVRQHEQLSEEYKEALLCLVDGFVVTASREEAASYLSRLVENKIEAPLRYALYRLEGVPGCAEETGHVRSGSLSRTTRHRTRSAWAFRPACEATGEAAEP